MNEFMERPVQIIVNGRAVLTVMTHADDPHDLVYGLLYTERVVDSMDNIDSVIVEKTQVSIVTKHPYSILLSRKTVLAGCGGASSFLDSGRLGRIDNPLAVVDAVLACSADAVSASSWVRAGLFAADGTLLHIAEDLTAQNAVDTLIGHALVTGIGCGDVFIVIRGNCTAETMRKLIIARVPILVLTGACTDAAVSLARESGLRLVRQ